MSKEPSEIKSKKPQIDIHLDKLELDNENPRLSDEYHGRDQATILKALYKDFDLEEIAFSMAENGYFDEEPIVVVPMNLPKTFEWDEENPDEVQVNLEKVIKSNDGIKFIVIEGNRRIATAKLMTNGVLRKTFGIEENVFPMPKNEKIKNDLMLIPAIIYKDKKDISPYLGVRHIIGVLKWEAFAKAKYIASRIEEEYKKWKNIEKSIQEVQRKVGDKRSDVIRKQYMYYKLFEQVESELSIETKNIIDKFSLVAVALSSPSIRNFIGVPVYKEVDFAKPLVPKNKLKNLDILLTWIFGNGKDKSPILTDSRKIPSRLSPILDDKESTLYLLEYSNLEEAYERSGGDKEFAKKKITSARRAITSALQVAYKYKGDKEILILLDELTQAIEELKKTVSKK